MEVQKIARCMISINRLLRCTLTHRYCLLKPLSVNPTKWSNTLTQFVGNLLPNYLSVFDHIVKWELKELIFTLSKIRIKTMKR